MEDSVDILVDGAVALNDSEFKNEIEIKESAKELVNSVKDANVSMAAVNAKINSFA